MTRTQISQLGTSEWFNTYKNYLEGESQKINLVTDTPPQFGAARHYQFFDPSAIQAISWYHLPSTHVTLQIQLNPLQLP
jgi:hypothetical protein